MGSPTIILIDDDYFIRDVACQLLAVNFPNVAATDSPATVLDWGRETQAGTHHHGCLPSGERWLSTAPANP
jgi:FixJ family two-component response regulator